MDKFSINILESTKILFTKYISIDELYSHNFNIINNIKNHIYEIIQTIVIGKINKETELNSSNITFDKNVYDFSENFNIFRGNSYICPYEMLINEDVYINIIKKIKKYVLQKKLDKFLDNFKKKYSSSSLSFNNSNNYDLELGKINYDYVENHLEKFKEDVEFYLKEIDRLKEEKYEKNMKNLTFMKKIKFYKLEEKIIDNDKYSIYIYSRNDHKRKLIFKNDEKIGRYKYHDTLKLLGYGRKIDIEKFVNPDWNAISRMPLNEQQISKYSDELNWKLICKHQKLSHNLLIKYYYKADWEALLSTRNFSPGFIIKFGDKIGWDKISLYWKDINEQFIINNIDKIIPELIYKNKYCTTFKNILEKLMG